MIDPLDLASDVRRRVPAYRATLAEKGVPEDAPFVELPLVTKKSYLLRHPVEELCWDGSLAGCHLIGASSGFSKGGSIFWPKRPQDEKAYLDSFDGFMTDCYAVDRKRTLELVCLAFGTWIGGIQIASMDRAIAASGRFPFTVATPGLNLAEAVRIVGQFGRHFDQVLWVINPSNIPLVKHLLEREGIAIVPGFHWFTAIGEYYTEAFRETVSTSFGHDPDEPFVVWTGYGSADTGDLGYETRETIRLRKLLHRRPGLSERLFGTASPPMLLAPSASAYLEVVGGNLVATKDQLIPLVRYDTGDAGGLLPREAVAALPGVPADLLASLPPVILWVAGRASDAVIFYGTNLMVADISDHLLSLDPSYGYAGFFEVRRREEAGVTTLRFTVYVSGDAGSAESAARYARELVRFLEGRSLEFATKYRALSSSVGRPLIEVDLLPIAGKDVRLKHRYVIEE